MDQIDEKLKQQKKERIHEIGVKVNSYKKTYAGIREHVVIKYTKNTFYRFMSLIFAVAGIIILLVGIVKKSNLEDSFSEIEGNDLYFYFVVLLSIGCFFLSYYLHYSVKKRNTVYLLSTLLSEVISYMENDVKREKERYEHLFDYEFERGQEEKELREEPGEVPVETSSKILKPFKELNRRIRKEFKL